MASKEPGLAALEAISEGLKAKYDKREDVEWRGHSMEWIRSKPSARIGKIGRLLVQALCEGAALRVKPVRYSLMVSNKRFQVRFSTGWSGGGFKFEQLRNEPYEAVFCLGITPERAYAWVIAKGAIFSAQGSIIKKEGLTPQHKGKRGSDTAWINVDVQSIPTWMSQYGDSIDQAMDRLRASL